MERTRWPRSFKQIKSIFGGGGVTGGDFLWVVYVGFGGVLCVCGGVISYYLLTDWRVHEC